MPRPATGTRERLVETATALIWSASYGSVSVDDICRTANVKKASFYHYFPSKTDLALAAMEGYGVRFRSDLEEIFAPSLSLNEKLERLVSRILARQEEMRERTGRVCGCPIAALGSEMAGQPEEKAILEKAEENFSLAKTYLLKALQEAIEQNILPQDTDPEARAADVHTFLTGQMIMARIHNDLEILRRDLECGLRRIVGIPLNNSSCLTSTPHDLKDEHSHD